MAPRKFNKIPELFKNLGIRGALLYIARHYVWPFKSHRPYGLNVKNTRYPVFCRPKTSDRYVFDQIFVEREYSCVDNLDDPKLIIDCGANVGYSSAYFLNRCKNSRVIAVEPDDGNYAMMVENLKPYRDRVQTVHSGIWSRPAGLTMMETQFRDGKEWSFQVRECREGEKPMFSAVEIGGLLEQSGHDRISILKIDVEGAEAVIFSSDTYKKWIDKVDTLLIELHDDSSFGKCSEIFFSAMKGEDFEFSTHGELTVCRRPA